MFEIINLRFRVWKLRFILRKRGISEYFSGLRSALRPQVVIFRGPTQTGEILSILRAGPSHQINKYFFVGRVLRQIDREDDLGRKWIFLLPFLANRWSCSFMLIEVSFQFRRMIESLLPSKLRTFYLPSFVEAIVAIGEKNELLNNRSLKEDIRKIRKKGFHYTITREISEFREFLDRYRKPHVEKVHGLDAFGSDMLDRMLSTISGLEVPKPWVLLKVKLDEEWVSGMVIHHDSKGARLWDLGVKDANQELVKSGALRAAYWLSVLYLQQEGYEKVSFMYVRPFLECGVLQYKLKYQPSLRVPSQDGFFLIPRKAPLVNDILRKEPFLQVRDGHLVATYFSTDKESTYETRSQMMAILRPASIEEMEVIEPNELFVGPTK